MTKLIAAVMAGVPLSIIISAIHDPSQNEFWALTVAALWVGVVIAVVED